MNNHTATVDQMGDAIDEAQHFLNMAVLTMQKIARMADAFYADTVDWTEVPGLDALVHETHAALRRGITQNDVDKIAAIIADMSRVDVAALKPFDQEEVA